MKLLNLTLLAAAISMSAQSFAHDKTPVESAIKESSSQIKSKVSRAEFLGLDSGYYVKTEAGVKQAKQLVKNQMLVTQKGAELASLTGKLVVKLQKGVSAQEFAASQDLRLDWESKNNLVILAAKNNADLLKVLDTVKSSPLVVRAKLDRAIRKNVTQ